MTFVGDQRRIKETPWNMEGRSKAFNVVVLRAANRAGDNQT